MSRAFLICPEPMREITAGVGSRFRALAKVLVENGHGVTLAVPNDPEEALALEGVEIVQALASDIGNQAENHDWVLLHAHLGNQYLSQRDDLPVVVDLYDPFLVENLHYHKELGFEPYANDHATWRLQLSRGDFFLCSSEEQRLYYLGWLTALGRVNPLVLEDDPELERLIAEVPFGTPDGQPQPPPDRSDVLPGVADEAPVLYFGGIYDWYDTQVVLDALPILLEQNPETVVVFIDHPHPELTPLSLASRTRKLAKSKGWLGSRVIFEKWRPFDRRFEVAQVCDLAVVTHRPGLETDLSLRTRLVDLMWLGLPSVVTTGGTMARVVDEEGAGAVVPPGDPVTLAAAIQGLIDNVDGRRRAATAARVWASGRSWSRVAEPLLEFADNPWHDRHRARFEEVTPGPIVGDEPLLRRIQRAVKRRKGRR